MTAHTQRSPDAGDGSQGRNNGEVKKNIWTSMLENVASGKRLPEKNLLVLGGTPESQRDFLESLSSSPEARRKFDRHKTPPMANSFALGYTYYEVLDTDQDDTLARVSLYLLSQPSPAFSSLIAPLLTPATIPNTALVILLDWAQPHLWLRQIGQWIQLFASVTRELGSDESEQMEEIMESWKNRGRGGGGTNLDGTMSGAGSEGEGSLPRGPGEWTDPLGLPLCVVCQNAGEIEVLEKNHGWKEPDFDRVLQYLRTVLLRHGASLIYTSQTSHSQISSLIHSTLGITSLLKRYPLKHNVIDRDQIVVPPNWDSWGKIRVLSEGFEVELVSQGWSEDLDSPSAITIEQLKEKKQSGEREDSAIARYENWCQDPSIGGLSVVEEAMSRSEAINVQSEDTQTFFEAQIKVLEHVKAKSAAERPGPFDIMDRVGLMTTDGREGISEHIGPVQFNVGGIHVDADDMLQRIKDRNAYSSAESPEQDSNVTEKYNNEQLQDFFNNLIHRKDAPAS